MNFEEKKNYMDQTLDFKINNGLNINYLNKKFGNLLDNVEKNFTILPWSRYENYEVFIDDYKDHKYKSISVVISNWERNIYIPYIIYQICNQDYPKSLIEIIIVDQGSTDHIKLQNICKQLATQYIEIKFKYFQHYDDLLENCRIRRNTGFRFSSNEIVLMIESDTIILGENYFKQLSWEFTKNNYLFIIPINLNIISHSDYINLNNLEQINYPYIKTDINHWLPNILIENKIEWCICARLDHDFCNAYNNNSLKSLKGFPEDWHGYGGIEAALYNKLHLAGIKPQYNYKLLSLQLYNFPYKLKSDIKISDYNNCYSVSRDINNYGITETMKEINLYGGLENE